MKAGIENHLEITTHKIVRVGSAILVAGEEVLLIIKNHHYKQVIKAHCVRCVVTAVFETNTGKMFLLHS